MPIDKLKIDKSFVDDLDKDNDDQEIVKTIISMAQNLNLKVIAEGVESKEQKEFLTKHGCMEIQGYYFYKPMSANDISNILKYLFN